MKCKNFEAKKWLYWSSDYNGKAIPEMIQMVFVFASFIPKNYNAEM